MQKIKRLLSDVGSFVRKYAYTDFYILIVLAIVFSTWVTQCALFGFIAFVVVTCVVLLFCDDVLPLTVNVCSAMMMIYTIDLDEYWHLWPVTIPLVLSIGVFVYNQAKTQKPFVRGRMFFPQLSVSVVLLLGGIGVVETQNYLDTLPLCIVLGFGVLAFYLLYVNCVKKDSPVKINDYFAKVLMYVGIVVSFELIVHIVRSGLSPADWSKTGWDLGWGNRNNAATLLVLCAPMALYLSTQKKFPIIYYFVAAFEYVCLVMTLSRGGILVGVVGAVIGIVLSVVTATDKKKSAIGLAAAVVALAIMFVAMPDWINGLIGSLSNRINGSNDISSGRFTLYKEAWGLFKQHPILGAGMGYVGTNAGMKNCVGIYWFHSTVFQVLGCLGLVGVAAYVYCYAGKIMLLVKNRKSVFAWFIFVAWFGFEGYSLIDTGTMSPLQLTIAVMTYFLEFAESNSGDKTQNNDDADAILPDDVAVEGAQN